MRNLLLIGIIAVAAFMAGWFTISRDDEHTTIKFNRDEIRNDARLAIDRGRELLNKKGQPATDGAGTQFTSRQDEYAQPYTPYAPENQYASEPQRPVTQNQQPSYQQPQYQPPQYYPQDQTAADPRRDWNRQQPSYPSPSYPVPGQSNPQPTQWQQPPTYPAGGRYPNDSYPSQASGYQVPRSY